MKPNLWDASSVSPTTQCVCSGFFGTGSRKGIEARRMLRRCMPHGNERREDRSSSLSPKRRGSPVLCVWRMKFRNVGGSSFWYRGRAGGGSSSPLHPFPDQREEGSFATRTHLVVVCVSLGLGVCEECLGSLSHNHSGQSG